MAPSIRHLKPADYRVMPWKNGLGTTTEIAAHPPGAGIDAFAWRISIADLGASGPFSSFPGVERILLQLEGEPMELVHEGVGRRRLALLSPHRFQGEWATHGELAAAPARDFNVMTRRGVVRADVAVHALARGSTVHALSAARTQIIYLLRGGVVARVSDAEVSGDGAGSVIELGAQETLIVEGDVGIDLGAAAEDAVAIVVTLA